MHSFDWQNCIFCKLFDPLCTENWSLPDSSKFKVDSPCLSHQYLTNVQCCYKRFGHQTIHPTQKFASMNLLQMPCVITWDQKKSVSILKKNEGVFSFKNWKFSIRVNHTITHNQRTQTQPIAQIKWFCIKMSPHLKF